MKTFLTFVLTSILGCLFVQTAQSQQNEFTLKVDKDTATINAGDSTTFIINFIIKNGFDASIFLKFDAGIPQMESGEAGLSAYVVNMPYSAVKLKVRTTAIFTKSGLYNFSITGVNGSLSSVVQCYVNVVTMPPPPTYSNWRIRKTVKNNEPVPEFVVQDNEENYWHGYNALQKEKKNTPIEQWGTTNPSNMGSTTIPPVIDPVNSKIWLYSRIDGQALARYTLQGTYKTLYDRSNTPLSNLEITALAIDTVINSVWVGTLKGLARLTGAVWTVFDSSNSVLGKEIITGIVVSGSIIWVGTQQGLAKYDGTSWTRFTPKNSTMPAPFVHSMAAEANGDLWMGLSNEYYANQERLEPNSMIGLAKFDGINWTLYTNNNSTLHKDNYVNSIAIDKKGNKWIASASHKLQDMTKIFGGAGILKFDNTKWVSFTTENSPLPDNRINWLGLDKNDNVWFHQSTPYDFVKSFWGVFNEKGLPFPYAPTDVEEQIEIIDGIQIFPNPTSSSFAITGAEDISYIRIMNSLGMEVVRQQGANGKIEVDVSKLQSGLYFVTVRSGARTIVKPVVVSH